MTPSSWASSPASWSEGAPNGDGTALTFNVPEEALDENGKVDLEIRYEDGTQVDLQLPIV